jgi:hypothetical protein
MDPVWRYERTLSFPISIARAWALFTDPKDTSAWLLPFTENEEGKPETTVEGQPPIVFELKVADVPKLLHTAMKGGNIPGSTEMIATFKEQNGGTRIDVAHLGFGDAERWHIFGTSFARGWDEAIGDLILYVRTGINLPRHIDDRRASIAAWPCRREWGIEIAEVFPGGFSDQAGIRPGDVLVKLDRAGIYELADIWTFTRVCKAGEQAEATYFRGNTLLSGKGRLSRFEDFGE